MRVQFPCWKKPQDKKDAIKKSKVEKVGAVPIGLVDAWEPFKGGASRLWALSELNNLDKHRALIPTMIGVEFSESYALLANEIPLDDFIDPFPARKMAIDGKPFISCLLESSPPVGTDVPCVCHLGLDGVEDIKGHGLLDELQWQVDTVHCVLLSFELGIEPEFKARETRKPVYTGNGIWLGPPEMRSDQVIKYVMTQQATAGGKAEGT